MDIGCVCSNVGTFISVKQAVIDGKPLYKKVITISGKVNNPSNIKIRIGTMVNEIIDQCGGYNGEPTRLISGGPMMGFAVDNDNIPVLKANSGFVVYNENDTKEQDNFKESPCIRCGQCINHCPMKLMPTMIMQSIKKKEIDNLKSLNAMNCFECGCCSFICPSRIQLTPYMKKAKKLIVQNKKLEEFKASQKLKKK